MATTIFPTQVQVGPAEYEELVGRIRTMVATSVPPGSTVLVVSKGDERLVDLGGSWEGWHFPQDANGAYTGYYPATSADAVDHLEELHRKGADFVLFPSTAFWWLSHYQEFAHHLNTSYALVARQDDTGLIYALREVRNRLGSFIDSLLPSDATVAVVSDGNPALLDVGRPAAHFPRNDGGGFDPDRFADGVEAANALESLRDSGTTYLVVPNEAANWLQRYPDFIPQVSSTYRRVAVRQHLCAVFDLAGRGGPSDRSGEPKKARQRTGLVAKLRRAFARGAGAGRGGSA
jgi:hypothetical protein